MADLAGLIERVERLTGPDALVDAEIYATIGGAPHVTSAGSRVVPFIWKGDPDTWPPVTASIDAAVALCDRALPWANVSATRHTNGRGSAELWRWAADRFETNDDNSLFYQNVGAATPAIALCIALLRAMEEQGRAALGGHHE